MAKHRVKVQYVTEVESESQQEAISQANRCIPGSTMNVQIECWTPKEKAAATELTPATANDTAKTERAAAA